MILMFVISVIVFVVLLVMAITGFGYLLVILGFIISKLISAFKSNNSLEKETTIINFEKEIDPKLIDRLNEIGTIKTNKNLRQINILNLALTENENINYCVKGLVHSLNNIFNDNCILFLTNKRIMFVTKKDTGLPNMIDLRYILNIEHKKGFGLDKIIIHLKNPSSPVKISGIDKVQAGLFKTYCDNLLNTI